MPRQRYAVVPVKATALVKGQLSSQNDTDCFDTFLFLAGFSASGGVGLGSWLGFVVVNGICLAESTAWPLSPLCHGYPCRGQAQLAQCDIVQRSLAHLQPWRICSPPAARLVSYVVSFCNRFVPVDMTRFVYVCECVCVFCICK